MPLKPDITWFDTGTHDALVRAGQYVWAMERDRGVHTTARRAAGLRHPRL
ncbi:hypothetical protein [Streptomyces caatingaensis]|nr:hypothetical protein [Streptomyces caatingaensis]